MLEPGTLVDKYRIVSVLGEGGMGVVYAAEHQVLRRPAAVKVLHPHIARNAEIAQRFLNEALAAARLAHRNIVAVHDAGTLPGGQTYIALEYLDGESLTSMLARRGGRGLELPALLRVVAEAACGLHVAHARGIVHRDVKPDNLFLARSPDGGEPRVVVLDFGIAKLGDDTGGLVTRTNAVFGTPPYMSPEQLRATRDAGVQADVYALGVIAYELATGRRPWSDELSAFELYDVKSRERAPDPRAHRPDLPGPWAAAVQRALEPRTEARWGSAQELVLALAAATPVAGSAEGGLAIVRRCAPELLRRATGGKTIGAALPASASLADVTPAHVATLRQDTPGAAARASFSTYTSSSGQVMGRPRPPSARRRAAVIALAAAATAAAAAAALLLVGSGSRDAASEGARPRDAASDAAPSPPATRTLTVETSPPGARVVVDGVSHGRAPIQISIATTTAVIVRASLDGHDDVSETLAPGTGPAELRLALPARPPPPVDAGAPILTTTADAAPPARPTSKRQDRSRPPAPARDAASPPPQDPPSDPPPPARAPAAPPSGAGSGSPSRPTWNPDDVGGD
jgi:serine/threonine-protein kinase